MTSLLQLHSLYCVVWLDDYGRRIRKMAVVCFTVLCQHLHGKPEGKFGNTYCLYYEWQSSYIRVGKAQSV